MMFLTPYTRRNNQLNPYNPFRDLEALERGFFGDNAFGALKADIKDAGDAYQLEADLPGFKKEDIAIDVEDGYVTIHAERHSEFEDKDKKGDYVRCERSFGSYERSFDTSGVDADHMKASFDNGVLTLTMPKLKEIPAEKKRLAIE
ncbi:MAG: Hsp20/alpha crystallin family protein [Oscillospiraceae bacterium]|nr:Hsp20/alpha crystallin family protein [Oscillospiraceae bacterium]